ncbi:Fanconi anemia group A protein-like isoform X2 [Pomacea canaliculata]|nr:Fanconi anemia group A protein-like isoform X2 [Pomacea canaliculata]
MKFIEALKSAGKIPLSLYSKYEEACKKETRQLLEGVFELDDEDNMDDMLLEPMEQLRLRLAQLSKAVASGNSENKVTEIISIIADKIENLLKTEGDKDCERSNVCLVENCQSDLELKHVQIVDQIMNCVCRSVYASQQADCLWLQQLVRMLSQQKVLHKAFFTRFLLLVQNKGMLLSEHHIDGLAMLSFYLQLDGSIFPSICLRAHQSKNKSFLACILLYLPCRTEQTMMYSIRFLMTYLKTALKYCGKLKTDEKDFMQLLPSCLLKLFCLLVWHLVPKTQPLKEYEFLMLIASLTSPVLCLTHMMETYLGGIM